MNRVKQVSAIFLGIAVFHTAINVSAEVKNYNDILADYKQEGTVPQIFEIGDGAGNKVASIVKEEDVYLTAKETVVRNAPGEQADAVQTAFLWENMRRLEVCDNGWSKVSYVDENASQVIGYVQDSVLTDEDYLTRFTEVVIVETDTDVLDYPGLRDGAVVGEVLQYDELVRTGTINKVWSMVYYEDETGSTLTGYIPTSCLKDQEKLLAADTDGSDEVEATEAAEVGMLSAGSGESVFADAVDQVADLGSSVVNGVQEGQAIAAPSDVSLLPLGQFRITHYCQCSICCGPWQDGITSTGVTATTNRTIAVDPTQIPYGSQVVINGQVYVAEDCGGAIKRNCIDIYVASHAEGQAKGVYYTDVYLIQ